MWFNSRTVVCHRLYLTWLYHREKRIRTNAKNQGHKKKHLSAGIHVYTTIFTLDRIQSPICRHVRLLRC